MKNRLIKIFLRWSAVLAGVLLISSMLQFGIWVKGLEIVEQLLSQISFPDAAGEKQGRDLIYRELGLDHFFIPDLWPFDNESLWH